MPYEAFQSSITMAVPADVVFDAIASLDGLRGWWTPNVARFRDPDDRLRFEFDGLGEHIDMRVDAVHRPSRIEWTCLVHSSLPEWTGTRVLWDIRPSSGSVSELCVSHVGLVPVLECFEDCGRGWRHFLASIRALVETGRGMPFTGLVSE
jgi:uncharacterized protein YndB with AHSA1/START domain